MNIPDPGHVLAAGGFCGSFPMRDSGNSNGESGRTLNKRGEGTVDWDTVASNCSTGSCLSNFNSRGKAQKARIERFEIDELMWSYSQFASQDLRPSGPNPWKVLARIAFNLEMFYSITYQKRCPGHPTLGNNIVHEIIVIRIGCRVE